MGQYDQYLAADHIRQLRRRYLARMTRSIAKRYIKAPSAAGKAGLITVVAVGLVSVLELRRMF